MIATATPAATTATRQRDGNAAAMVMDSDGWCDDNAMIRKRLGKRIVVRKCPDFDVADDICNELRDEYVLMEINNQNKEWMVVATRGRRWSKDDDGAGDESNTVSKEDYEEGENEDGDASGSVDFFNGGGGAKDKDKETENDKGDNGG